MWLTVLSQRLPRWILLVVLCASANAESTINTESFDRDPEWEALNNRAAKPQTIKQDFGYHPDGKIGGSITMAAEPAYYAKKIPTKTFDDELSASGTLVCADELANALVGFFNADTLKEWRTPNTIALRIVGRRPIFYAYVEYASQRWRVASGHFLAPSKNSQTGGGEPFEFAAETVHHWSLKYESAANNGAGRITATIDDQTAVCDLNEEHRQDGATFNRFGMLNVMKHASDEGELWLDDLIINGEKEDLTKDPRWEEFQNRRTYETFDARPNSNFGFSRTHYANGKSPGEIGGLIFRRDIRLPEGMNYYADRLDRLTLEGPLVASGKIAFRRGVTDSSTLIGFFHVPTSVTVDPNAPRSPRNWIDYLPKCFLGVAIEGPSREGFFFHPTYRLDGDEGGGTPNSPIANCPRLNPDSLPHDWRFEYSPAGADGKGQIKVTLDGQAATLDLAPGHKMQDAQFNRFGNISNWVDGNGQVVYLDDLTYTVRQK